MALAYACCPQATEKACGTGGAVCHSESTYVCVCVCVFSQAAELSSLKHQLSLLVAQPLVPRMSKAFFTGQCVHHTSVQDTCPGQ